MEHRGIASRRNRRAYHTCNFAACSHTQAALASATLVQQSSSVHLPARSATFLSYSFVGHMLLQQACADAQLEQRCPPHAHDPISRVNAIYNLLYSRSGCFAAWTIGDGLDTSLPTAARSTHRCGALRAGADAALMSELWLVSEALVDVRQAPVASLNCSTSCGLESIRETSIDTTSYQCNARSRARLSETVVSTWHIYSWVRVCIYRCRVFL